MILGEDKAFRIVEGCDTIDDLNLAFLSDDKKIGFIVSVAYGDGVETVVFEPTGSMLRSDEISLLHGLSSGLEECSLLMLQKEPFRSLVGAILLS